MTTPSEKRFTITLVGQAELSISDIWPDGDAPEDPDEDDVLFALEQSGHGDVSTVLVDWNLDHRFSFHVCSSNLRQSNVDDE